MTIAIAIAANMLAVSPLNVRKVQNSTADEQLRADIVARGLLQNLIGIAVRGKKGRYEITAGGRRLTQIHAAIELGELPEDYTVPVLVMGNKEDAREASLAENFQRLAMNPADECIAFQHIMAREGADPAAVAKRFGLTERFVRGRLRLAGLAAVVFTALRDGDITLDLATAFAATSDTAQQARVFEQTKGISYGMTVSNIRRMITDGGYTGTHAKAKLVGRDAYLAAGGTIDGDLFADGDAETWTNRELLDSLAADKLAAAAAELAVAEGIGNVRVVGNENEVWRETRELRPIVTAPPVYTEEQTARVEAIEEELEALEDAHDEDGNYTEEQVERSEVLNAEYVALRNPAPVLTDEQKASAIAFVYLDRSGEVLVHHQVYTAPSSSGAGDSKGDTNDDDDVAASASGDAGKAGLSQRLAEELAHQKTEIVAVHVASDPHFALDLGTFIMVDQAINHSGSRLASELRANTPASRIGDYKTDGSSAAEWLRLSSALDASWSTLATPEARFDAFRGLDDGARAAWLGWAVARTLCAVPAGKTGSSFIDHLGQRLDIDVASWWRPSAANYFDRVPKSMTVTALTDVGGTELAARYGNAKKAELASAAEKLFRGDVIVEAATKTAALRWVPASMAFGSDTASIEDEIAAAEAAASTDNADLTTAQDDSDDAAIDEDEQIAEAA